MQQRAGMIAREIGAAIAVLSLYILVLLAPLHQSAGLQRDLDALGYSSLDFWSICQPLTVDGTEDPIEVAKCPVAGVGKYEVALATPPSIDIPTPDLATVISYPVAASGRHLMRPPYVGQARAPPVTV